jgi:hypothetical protein
MVNKVFILAFNYEEAKLYIKKNPGEYIVLHRPEQIRGMREFTVRVMPNAYRREDYNDMIDAINIRRGIIVR